MKSSLPILFLLFMMLLLLFATAFIPVQAAAFETADMELTFQDRVNPQTDIASYKIFYDIDSVIVNPDPASLPFLEFFMVDLQSGTSVDPTIDDYVTMFIIQSPDGDTRNYFFAMKAVDKMGRESPDWSNEVEAIIDFLPPGAPEIIDLKLIINGRKVRIIIN